MYIDQIKKKSALNILKNDKKIPLITLIGYQATLEVFKKMDMKNI